MGPLSPHRPARILCVGGATVDRTYRLAAPLVPESSNPATARSGFGGVARNVAENLSRLGIPTGLLSRVGDDEAGRSLLAGLDACGIDRRGVLPVASAATADYVAVLTPGGDLALGLAAMAVLDRLTPEALADHADLFAAADWVVADCNLPAESLLALARRRPPGRYRLAVDAVSVAKSARLPETLEGFDLLFLNRDEALAVAGRHGLDAVTPAGAAAAMLRAGAGAAVVTLGAGGALAAGAAGIVAVPAVPAGVVDVTGAGDALIAAVIAALTGGADLPEAVARGCRAAARALGCDTAVAATGWAVDRA